jgi:taurine dioxygenase
MQDVLDIEVRPLSPACGAEIRGVDLTKPLTEAQVNAIKNAWAKHLVLVFRGQQVSQDDQLRFAPISAISAAARRRRSRCAAVPGASGTREGPLVTNIESTAADRSVRPASSGSTSTLAIREALQVHVSLRARTASRGNTMFSNMYKAYEAVPAALKEKLRGKKALHIHEYNRAKQAGHSGDISSIPHYYHPVFITHPDTGRKTLFVDRLMTTRIEGVSQEESDAILEQLYEIGECREFIFEHVWKLGDFLMWDNRCTIHARTDFPKEERRLLRRCTVEGEPVYE